MLDVVFGDMIDFLGDDKATQEYSDLYGGYGQREKIHECRPGLRPPQTYHHFKAGASRRKCEGSPLPHGRMAGDDAVYEAAFRRTGAVRVGEIAELFAAAQVLDSKKLPAGPRLAIVTSAGGPGVMATDALIHLGGELAVLSDESMVQLNTFLPPHWSKANPVDVLGDATVDRFAKALCLCLDDPMVDGVLVIYVPMDSAPSTQLAHAVADSVKNACEACHRNMDGLRRRRGGKTHLC